MEAAAEGADDDAAARAEASLLVRRVEVFGSEGDTAFFGIQLTGNGDWESGWFARSAPGLPVIESPINVENDWRPVATRWDTRRTAPPPPPRPGRPGIEERRKTVP